MQILDYTAWRSMNHAMAEATYDQEADAAYFPLVDDRHPERQYDCGYGIILDLDANNNVVGIEVLGAGSAYRAREAAGLGGREAVREHADELERLGG